MAEAPISHIHVAEEEEEVEGNVENHIPDEEPTEEEKLAMLQEFISRTGSDEATAGSFLEAHEYIFADAVADYLSQVEGHDVNADEDEGQDRNADCAQHEEDPRSESVKSADGASFEDPSDVSTKQQVEVSSDPQMPAQRNIGAEGTAKLVVQADTEVSPFNSEEQALGDNNSEGAAMPLPNLDSDLHSIPLTDGAPSTGRSPGGEEIENVDEVAERIRREVAELASEAGREAREALSGIGHKVLEGLGSLGAGSPTEGGGGLKEFGSKLSSWWTNRGPSTGAQASADSNGQSSVVNGLQEPSMDHIRMLFPELGEDEELMQSFPCKLTQTYQCSHNKYTPDIQMAFQGTLYILGKHTCFSAAERGRNLPIILEHAQIMKLERLQPSRRSTKTDVLKLQLSETEWMCVKDFESDSLGTALALLASMCPHAVS